MTPRRILAFALLALVAGTACGRYGTSYAAVVEGRSISFEELDKQVKTLATSRGIQNVTDAQRPALQKEALVQLIQREIVRDQVAKSKIQVPDAKVAERFDQVRSRFPDPQQFAQALSQQGFTEQSLRDGIREQIGFEILAERVAPVQISEQRLAETYAQRKADFEQVHARHILIATENRTPAAALARANETLAKLRSGTDFATLAAQVSDDPSAKQNSGDLGTQARSYYDADFAKAAFSIPLKKVSEPVKTQFGYHLIEALERSTVTFAEAKDQLRQELVQQEQQAGVSLFLEKIAKSADIEVNPRIGEFDAKSFQIVDNQFFSPAPTETSPAPGFGFPLPQ